jgi:hypothetical protein
MKVSTILSYAIFFLVLVFSTTLFAADASSVKQVPRKTSTTVTPATLNTIGKLPSLIKINPADLDMTTALFDANMVKAKKAGEDLNVLSKDIATVRLPKLEKNISDMKTKMNECSNKAYTTEDQKNAGCTDNMTTAQCSKKLYKHCLAPSFGKIWGTSSSIETSAGEAASDAQILHDIASYFLDYITNYSK